MVERAGSILQENESLDVSLGYDLCETVTNPANTDERNI
jgi:hypothetical protein